ncbi:carbohydrate-binding protein [Petroclostridium sp. X23]|uniref:carbohydrate-binding protein n=1 Tax=Petroclostridium sp. X23 TaxID=3045146 RepID=UPI0024ADE15C|nr:carbohydrate-binding protein [Petroclostridium sp. X23]WHH58917.1 carbohydrate-binding protein [Petroclostridium sp. X23]
MGFFDFLFGARRDIEEVVQQQNTEILHLGSSEMDAFKEEYSTEIYDIEPIKSYNSYSNYGVQLKSDIYAVRIIYDGLLIKSGAQEVYAAVGYGNNLKWEDVDYYPLHKVNPQAFELILPVKREGNINIAFKDNIGNWDNNSGMNYCFENNFYPAAHSGKDPTSEKWS